MQKYLTNFELLIAKKFLLNLDEEIKVVLDPTKKEVRKNKEFYQDLFTRLKSDWNYDICLAISYIVMEGLEEHALLDTFNSREHREFLKKRRVTEFINNFNDKSNNEYSEKRWIPYRNEYNLKYALSTIRSYFRASEDKQREGYTESIRKECLIKAVIKVKNPEGLTKKLNDYLYNYEQHIMHHKDTMQEIPKQYEIRYKDLFFAFNSYITSYRTVRTNIVLSSKELDGIFKDTLKENAKELLVDYNSLDPKKVKSLEFLMLLDRDKYIEIKDVNILPCENDFVEIREDNDWEIKYSVLDKWHMEEDLSLKSCSKTLCYSIKDKFVIYKGQKKDFSKKREVWDSFLKLLEKPNQVIKHWEFLGEDRKPGGKEYKIQTDRSKYRKKLIQDYLAIDVNNPELIEASGEGGYKLNLNEDEIKKLS